MPNENFPTSPKGQELANILIQNNHLEDDKIFIRMFEAAKIPMQIEFYQGDLVGFYFPESQMYLLRYGPDNNPVWIFKEQLGED